MRVLLLVPLLGLACGTTEPSPLSKAQARLRQVFAVAEGGARQLLYLVDSRTGEACDFGVSRDLGSPGTCAPAGVGYAVYLDERCERPFVETYAAGPAWVVLASPGGASGDRIRGLVRLGARVVRPPVVRALGESGCVEVAPSSVPISEIAEELPRASLSEGFIGPRDVGNNLEASAFADDEGSSLVFGLIDRTSGARCSPGPTTEGPRCVPEATSIAHGGLLDERCDRIAYADFLGGPVAVVTDLGGATVRFEPRLSGLRVTVGRRGAGDACITEEREIPRDRALYFGVPYPPSEWPALSLARSGGPRITAARATLPDGTPYFERPARFEDRGAPCGPMWVEGTLRCLPQPIYPSYSVYSDPECRSRVAIFEGAPPPYVTVVDDTGGATEGNLMRGRVRGIGAEVAEAYMTTRLGCLPAPQDQRKAYAFAEDVDPRSFAELRLVTE